jgi:hypothetical protein
VGADLSALSGPDAGSALVVDVANVMGSRPDGWWRDRAGAAARLVSGLASADLDYGEVVAVLEGRSRAGSPAGPARGVVVVHASGSGDDAIVAEAASRLAEGSRVAVVTADRGLQARVEAAGATVLRPSWLLARLAA